MIRLLALLSTAALATAAPETKDLVYAEVGERELKLDLFLPEEVEDPPLVVFIHGGGWRKGSYKGCRLASLTEEGFAVASIGYRLSDVATFPAQIHDCKGALRWLRANQERFGYDAERVAVAGTSAGGHLAMLMGTSGGVEALEGEVGGNLDQSSRVQAVVNYFGPSDFVLRSRTHPAKTEDPGGSVFRLLGGPASERLELARQASPAWHVDHEDPPILSFHGALDEVVQINQAERIRDLYGKVGLDFIHVVLEDAGHGGREFFTGERRTRLLRFLREHLELPR